MTIKYRFDPQYVRCVLDSRSDKIVIHLREFLDLRKAVAKVYDLGMTQDSQCSIQIKRGDDIESCFESIGWIGMPGKNQKVSANILDAKTIVIMIDEQPQELAAITGEIE